MTALMYLRYVVARVVEACNVKRYDLSGAWTQRNLGSPMLAMVKTAIYITFLNINIAGANTLVPCSLLVTACEEGSAPQCNVLPELH